MQLAGMIINQRADEMQLQIGPGSSGSDLMKAPLRLPAWRQCPSRRGANRRMWRISLYAQPRQAQNVGVAGLGGIDEIEMILQVLADARHVPKHFDAPRAQVLAGPMPDSISSCGELKAPPHRITSARALTWCSAPALR
jgi:hypothetical protein